MLFVVANLASTSSPPNEADLTVTLELSVNSKITYGLGSVVEDPTVPSPSGSFTSTGAVLSSLNLYSPDEADWSLVPNVPVFEFTSVALSITAFESLAAASENVVSDPSNVAVYVVESTATAVTDPSAEVSLLVAL